jgi:hypothetical protein
MDASDNTDFPAYLQIENLLQLSDEQLKRKYLNYLKSIEKIAQITLNAISPNKQGFTKQVTGCDRFYSKAVRVLQ